jgi:peptidylprolyl isomerase
VAQAKKGDQVQVHYTGRLEDGTVFDTSHDREPLAFTLGEGNVIAGFESAIDGMNQGETKTTTIPADDAYGAHNEEMVIRMERSNVPDSIDPEVGQNLQIQLQNGQQMPVVVTEVTDSEVVIDANHPLAGQTLIFDIELVGVSGT